MIVDRERLECVPLGINIFEQVPSFTDGQFYFDISKLPVCALILNLTNKAALYAPCDEEIVSMNNLCYHENISK